MFEDDNIGNRKVKWFTSAEWTIFKVLIDCLAPINDGTKIASMAAHSTVETLSIQAMAARPLRKVVVPEGMKMTTMAATTMAIMTMIPVMVATRRTKSFLPMVQHLTFQQSSGLHKAA